MLGWATAVRARARAKEGHRRMLGCMVVLVISADVEPRGGTRVWESGFVVLTSVLCRARTERDDLQVRHAIQGGEGHALPLTGASLVFWF